MPDSEKPGSTVNVAGTDKIPVPADPRCRERPLPWQSPKPPEDDPEAPARVQAIMDSAGYRPVTEDADFLASYQARGARLQLDYLKPETRLTEYGVQHTIVVFGSTRIPEPLAAQRKVLLLRKELAENGPSAELEKQLARAERILAKRRYYEIAREFGRLVGLCGGSADNRITLMTGGGPGIMEAANRGAFDIDANSIGLNISLPHEQYPNPYITPDLCFSFHYFSMRKLHFLLRAKALVVFPGGFGTLDELFETLTLVQTRKIRPLPIVLVGEGYWRQVFDIDFLVAEGVVDPEDCQLFGYAETAADIWQGILNWHERAGAPLVSPCPDLDTATGSRFEP
jgi:uncharacterized protein (TIGR00730 family)